MDSCCGQKVGCRATQNNQRAGQAQTENQGSTCTGVHATADRSAARPREPAATMTRSRPSSSADSRPTYTLKRLQNLRSSTVCQHATASCHALSLGQACLEAVRTNVSTSANRVKTSCQELTSNHGRTLCREAGSRSEGLRAPWPTYQLQSRRLRSAPPTPVQHTALLV